MSTEVTGELFVAGGRRFGQAGQLRAFDPVEGTEIEPVFGLASRDDAEEAAAAAADAFRSYRAVPAGVRAEFLRSIASGLQGARDELVSRATRETGLSVGRLGGEVTRTANQLRLFAAVLDETSTEGIRIDPSVPERSPLPRPDIRQRRVPLGPVVVFGASNFPFAFSTAGGDTAAALAAGCPVIVKGHHAHPGTGELVADIVVGAARAHGLADGVFQVLLGSGRGVGVALVEDARIQAVGFTGSRSGGLALTAAAQARPVPIPVYAEMSSVNPVFVLPSAADARRGEDFAASLALGSGQFCTNPGLVFVPVGTRGDAFVTAAAAAVGAGSGQPMLSPQIHAAFVDGCAVLAAHSTQVAHGVSGIGDYAPAPRLFETTLADFLSDERLRAEVFGAAGLIVRYDDVAQLLALVPELEGQLTATIHVDLDGSSAVERTAARQLVSELELRVGRVLFGGWPTGVEVGHAMVHGGPFPATSDGRSTSVGSLSIERFQRPVAYQGFPQELLPSVLQDDTNRMTVHRVDGRLVLPEGGGYSPPVELLEQR